MSGVQADGGPGLKRTGLALAAGLVIVTGLGVAGLAVSTRSGAAPAAEVQHVDTPVEVIAADFAASVEIEDLMAGFARPRRDSLLGFETSGRVVNITADIGDRVRRGQELARLDSTALQAQRAAMQARLRQAEAETRLAEVTVGRQKTLWEQGHQSRQRFDEASAEADARRAAEDAVKADIAQIDARLALAVIRAPFDGVVLARGLDEGAIANPGAMVLELVETGALEAEIGVPEHEAATLQIGATYDFLTEAGEAKAVLRAVTGVVANANRAVTAVFDFVGESQPAMGAVVRLKLPRQLADQGFWTATASLTESARGLWSVYVAQPQADGGHKIEPRLVEILFAETDRSFVRGTIAPGDLIVQTGIARLAPGQWVTPQRRAPSDRSIGPAIAERATGAVAP